MTRERWGWLVLLGLAIALFTWIARHTYWADAKVPMPLRGEAVTNPFYATERFARALGARAQWTRGLNLPSSQGVVFISEWNWDLSSDRRHRIEQWVEAGGRLVVDQSLIGGTDSFERWSGIGHKERVVTRRERPGTTTERVVIRRVQPSTQLCYTLTEEGSSHDSYSICGMSSSSSLTTTRKIDWALRREEAGIQAVRVKIGSGSVTVLNGEPFVGRGLFDDDNGILFVAATQLRRGDEIHFFSEAHHASLLDLAWELGWPVICLVGMLLALMIWRNSVRFGPLAAPTETARRSLAEQIRGTGQFALRIGSASALHAAAARALNEVAALHIRAYQHLPGSERMSALALATGYESDALAAALNYSGSSRSEHLRAAIELLEAARRRILIKNTRSRHGNRNEYAQPGR
jgi:hypothetical protein